MGNLVDRQVAIDEIARFIGYIDEDMIERIQLRLRKLPSAEPEIVYCKDCKKHNISVEDTWDKYQKWCPLVAYRGKAQGHEFDYQYCVCGERRQDG